MFPDSLQRLQLCIDRLVATQEEREFKGYKRVSGNRNDLLFFSFFFSYREDLIRLAVTNNKEHKLFGRRMIRFRDKRSHVSGQER
jgi:hypothetical protein